VELDPAVGGEVVIQKLENCSKPVLPIKNLINSSRPHVDDVVGSYLPDS
jgi:hypothetical protein